MILARGRQPVRPVARGQAPEGPRWSMWLWRGRGAQAGQVGGEQTAARRIPARIRPSRLGEHRTEYDDLTRGHILLDGAVRPPAVDDLPQNLVDLLANGTG